MHLLSKYMQSALKKAIWITTAEKFVVFQLQET